MAFSIEFLDEPIPADKLSPGEAASYGKITIGDFSERIILSLNSWSKSDYYRQWVEAVQRFSLEPADGKSALITDVSDAAKFKYPIMWWPLFKEGDKVYVHNGYAPIKLKPGGSVDIKDTYNHIGTRESGVSEWVTPIDDLQQWLITLKAGTWHE